MNSLKLLDGAIKRYGSSTATVSGKVGTISDDRSAIVGKGGWCFGYDGTPNGRDSYRKPEFKKLSGQWATVIESRQRAFETQKIKFLQLVVPNKLSVLSEYFPERLDTSVGYILGPLLEAPGLSQLLCPLQEFRSPAVRDHVFRKNDNHLTVAGNALITQLALDKLALARVRPRKVNTFTTQHFGDLGSKFTTPISENLVVPDWEKGLLASHMVQKVTDVQTPRLVGTRQVFTNRNAPVKGTLVVFGDSYFEKVPSWGLSPFFAAIFSEFHFVWSGEADMAYTLEAGADYVITQTCERFMGNLPQDRL